MTSLPKRGVRHEAPRAFKPPPPKSRRDVITPEGVPIALSLAERGDRAAAFMLDAVIIFVVLLAISLLAQWATGGALESGGVTAAFVLVVVFALRNFYFLFFEIRWRGQTPGKRSLKIRVVDRRGGPLTADAVVARNLMREIEVFLPLSFLAAQAGQGAADGFLILFGLSWSGIFLFFPLFNRDRLRVGDLIAGTWVVNSMRGKLGHDLVQVSAERPRRVFTEAALDLYGIYELQMLEDVLRKGRDEAIITVAATIRRKAGLPDDGDDQGFLSDYYAALCARLERGMMVGRRRENKHAEARGR